MILTAPQKGYAGHSHTPVCLELTVREVVGNDNGGLKYSRIDGNGGLAVNVQWVKDGHQGGAAKFGLTNAKRWLWRGGSG